MLTEQQISEANALAVRCHGSESTVTYEVFRTWAMLVLKHALTFDGGLWGLLPAQPSVEAGLCGARVYGLRYSVAHDFTSARAVELFASAGVGRVSVVCVDDPDWQGSRHSVLQDHARRFGLLNTLLMRYANPDGSGQQFLMVSRTDAALRFDKDDAALFALLAPHLMQAFATRRRYALADSRADSSREGATAVAVVDRAGYVHEQHVRFAAMFQREWSDWSGDRVPAPLQALTSRYAGTNWQFLGTQIVADFLPVDDLYVVSARPRSASDDLTERELAVARRYAAGGSFREVAESLNVAPATVRSHLRNVFAKLQVRNKTELASMLR